MGCKKTGCWYVDGGELLLKLLNKLKKKHAVCQPIGESQAELGSRNG